MPLAVNRVHFEVWRVLAEDTTELCGVVLLELGQKLVVQPQELRYLQRPKHLVQLCDLVFAEPLGDGHIIEGLHSLLVCQKQRLAELLVQHLQRLNIAGLSAHDLICHLLAHRFGLLIHLHWLRCCTV